MRVTGRFLYLFYSLRPKQWIKNGFLFLPLIFAGRLFAFPENLKVLIAAGLFCLASGAVYLMNDILDLENDKVHPLKKMRPLAAGKISVQQAALAAGGLGVLTLFSAFTLDRDLGWLLSAYFLLNLLYSRLLKQMVILDVFCIGAFFLIRLLSGGAVAGVEVSHWIVFMTVLLSLFLGFNKRRQEIKLLGHRARTHRIVLAKYDRYFLDQMIMVVTAAIVVSYMLYTVDERTVEVFGTRHLMYTIPFVYYGIFRYSYLLRRWHKEGDPSRILLADRQLQWNLLAWVAMVISVIYLGV